MRIIIAPFILMLFFVGCAPEKTPSPSPPGTWDSTYITNPR